MPAIYNEIDPFAASWLRNLIATGHVAPGIVDERSIVDLKPADVAGPGQRHFFAGIGGWSYAARLAGIADDADLWTGSCPCQGLSDAGKRLGARDPRHLWPTWFELIRECRPPTIFGEQVASRLGLDWLDLVRSDLEGCGYAVGASDLCAASVGAPHIRQRIYFVAYAGRERCEGKRLRVQPRRSRSRRPEVGGAARLVVDSGSARSGRNTGGLPDAQATSKSEGRESRRERDESVDASADGRMGDPHRTRSQSGDSGDSGSRQSTGSVVDVVNTERERSGSRRLGGSCGRSSIEPDRHGADGFWRPCDWFPCTDGVSRPVEPGTFPLAHGVSGRVGRLRGYGNAIVPQVAAEFIEAAESVKP